MTPSVGALSAWESFYVIVGSSAGALIGLQFVVMTLSAGRRRQVAPGTLDAFATPTVVHFGAALVGSTIMSAPWPSLVSMAIVLAAFSVAGLAYGVLVSRCAHRLTDYTPVASDWLWFVALPCVSYAVLATSGVLLRTSPVVAPFGIAAGVLSLLLLGIRNAWDTVTYIVATNPDAGAPTTD
jgi:hypothetical protein